jgi:hypothetical protein
VRTTLTLDDDVAAQLREEAQRQGLPFKQVVNRAIRLGLRAGDAPAARKPFRTQARALGLRPGIDPTKLGQLADELEVQEFAKRYRELEKRGRAGESGASDAGSEA